jgi:hypothetical protein
VKVHYGEGVAIRIGPEPCAGTREGDGEASIGEHRGVPCTLRLVRRGQYLVEQQGKR